MAKVAVFTHGIKQGPFAKLSTALARGFQQLGVECDVVVLSAAEEDRARYPDVRVVSLGVKRASSSLLPLMRYLKDQQPSILFSMPWYFNVAAIWARALAGTPTKVIMVEQNIISLESQIDHSHKLQTRYLPLLMRFSYPYGDGLVAVCQDTIDDLRQEVGVASRLPMQVIHNPIEPQRIRQRAAEPLNHPWFVDRQVPVILTVARLAHQKQLDRLIRAVAQMMPTCPVRLMILGEGPLRSDLEALCHELQISESVAIPGYDHNPYRFMGACDLFVLASAWEGSPVALAEAMAAGAPTLVTDGPGGSKEVVGRGQFGAMVTAADLTAAKLAETMTELLNNPSLREHYRQQGQRRAQDFQYVKICQAYLDFANSVGASRLGPVTT